MKNLLVTGRPGVGKTTLIRAVADRPMACKAAGFFTREIREGGKRTGFKIETLDGRAGILASVSAESGPRVGRYRVNLDDLERIGVACIEKGLENSDLIVIDEIGKMELFSKRFRDVVERAFDSRIKVVATIKVGPGRFTERLTGRSDTEVLLLTEANRDSVLEEVLGFVECAD
ncbi:MAG: NTPase [bacterium]